MYSLTARVNQFALPFSGSIYPYFLIRSVVLYFIDIELLRSQLRGVGKVSKNSSPSRNIWLEKSYEVRRSHDFGWSRMKSQSKRGIVIIFRPRQTSRWPMTELLTPILSSQNLRRNPISCLLFASMNSFHRCTFHCPVWHPKISESITLSCVRGCTTKNATISATHDWVNQRSPLF